MPKNLEIADNPNILLIKDIDSNLIQLEGIKLNEDVKKINIGDIVDIHVIDYEEQYSNFAKKVEQFNNHDGWIHMAGDFTFGIKNKKIDSILLKGKYVDKLRKFQYQDIINALGSPDKILVDFLFDLWGDTEDAKILVYSKQKLYFFLDVKTLKIKEVHIGNINEKQYEPEDIDIVKKRNLTIVSRKKTMKWFLYGLIILSATFILFNLL